MRYDIVALTLHCSNTPWMFSFGHFGYWNGAWFPESLVSMDIGMVHGSLKVWYLWI